MRKKNVRKSPIGKKFLFLLLISISLLGGRPAPAATLLGKLNPNTAQATDLALLPGIGPAKAARIVARRKQRPFHSWSELGAVPGIGPKILKKLRPYLDFSGPNNLRKIQEAGRKPEIPPCFLPLLHFAGPKTAPTPKTLDKMRAAP